MPPKKRQLHGPDDGEGHPWKVVRAKEGKVNVFYGKGGDVTFKLKKEDKKVSPTEQLVLQRIGEYRQDKRKQAEGGGGGKKAKGSRLSAEFPHLHTAGRPGRGKVAASRVAGAAGPRSW